MSSAATELLWRPSTQRIAEANLTAFMRHVADERQADITDFPALYEWSIARPEQFWRLVWLFCGVVASHGSTTVVADFDKMPGVVGFPTRG